MNRRLDFGGFLLKKKSYSKTPPSDDHHARYTVISKNKKNALLGVFVFAIDTQVKGGETTDTMQRISLSLPPEKCSA
jgi:hypothetical protein